MRKLFVTLVGLMLVCGEWVWSAYSDDNAKSADQQATVAQVAPGKKITALGTVEPEEVVDVNAQVGGRIVSLGADPHAKGKSIDYGSSVEVGTVLAQIESELYAVRVEQERAGCARAEAELALVTIRREHAEDQWNHAQVLEKSKAISDSDFDLAKFNYKEAKASMAVAKAALAQSKAARKEAEIRLTYTTIRSPIKGVLIDRRVNVGQMVTPANASALFLVAKLDKFQVWASVKEADVVRIHRQQPVHFTVDAYPGKVFEGKVQQIRLNAAMTQNVVTYTVVVAVSGTREELYPYLTAHVEFE